MNNDGSISCLDHGFVRLVDVMGNDTSIVQAARVSYGEGTKTVSDDRGLIRYLLRHRHTTPFEMVEFKFHVKMPIFLARQWQRHRTASINEVSARYSKVKEEFYAPRPAQLRGQDTMNRQGSKGSISNPTLVAGQIIHLSEEAFEHYDILVERDSLVREQARMILPQNAYTEFYWKIDLHNLMHFLRLRLDSHAQQEIREYAQALYELITPHVPIAIEAFEDYVLNAITFSAEEQKVLRWMMGNPQEDVRISYNLTDCPNNLTPAEMRDFRAKLEAMDGR